MDNLLSRSVFALAVLASSAAADDTSLVVSPSWGSVTRSEGLEFSATHCGEPVSPIWTIPIAGDVLGQVFPIDDGVAVVPFGVGEDTLTALDPDGLLDDGTATVRVLPPASLVITSARYRHDEDGPKRRLVARGYVDTGVVANAVEEQGDELWPFAFAESATSTMWANGLASGAIVELPSKGEARRFVSVEGEVKLTLVPTRAPSRFRFALRWRSSIDLDPDGELELMFEHGGFLDATGSVALTDGRFSARKQPTAIGRPDLAILAGKAKLAEGADDTLKLVLATTELVGDVDTPRDVRVCLGDGTCFAVAAEDFVVKKGRWIAKKVGAVRSLVVDTRRQRVTLSVQGGELGDWPESGVVISSLRLDVGERARKIGVIVAADGARLDL